MVAVELVIGVWCVVCSVCGVVRGRGPRGRSSLRADQLSRNLVCAQESCI